MSMITRSRMTTTRATGMAGRIRMVAMGTARMNMDSSIIMTATIRNDKTTTTCGDLTHRIAGVAVVRFKHFLGSTTEHACGRGRSTVQGGKICYLT